MRSIVALWTGSSECGGYPAEGVADLLGPATLRPAGVGGISVALSLLPARGTGFLTMFGTLIG